MTHAHCTDCILNIYMFERKGVDILNILLRLTRIHLSRNIWNNSYLFIIITMLLVLDSKMSVYVDLQLLKGKIGMKNKESRLEFYYIINIYILRTI